MLVLLGLALPAFAQTPAGTAFTYQGRLADTGSPANGPYDFRLILYDADVGGSQVGPVVTVDDAVVTDGLFTANLDFGPGTFTGSSRFLEIGVRPGASGGTYTVLGARQELKPAPHSVFSQQAPWTGINGKPAGFADDVDNDVLAGLACGSGQIAKWNGTAWACATDADSGGDITGVTAGTGLTGGGTTGVVTLNVNFAGSGGAATASRTDHDHFGQTWTGVGATGLDVDNPTGVIGLRGRFTGTSGSGIGVYGLTNSTQGTGVYGFATPSTGAAIGVVGVTDSTSGGNGVFGEASATTGTTYGVVGSVNSTAGYAGFFNGRVQVTGTLSKGGGSFKIDHPLDPENKYLYHSFVESPDMMNIYDGVVTTDTAGYATVELPDWFEALNRDFRYQLTVIDESDADGFVLAKVVQEVRQNSFRLRTSAANVRVSWQVTGIRKDGFAEKHRIPVEEEKPADERGTYLHPDAWDQPKEKGLDYRRRLPLMEREREMRQRPEPGQNDPPEGSAGVTSPQQ